MTGQAFTFTEFYFAPIVLNNKALKGRFGAQYIVGYFHLSLDKLGEMYLLFIQNISPLLISLSLPYKFGTSLHYPVKRRQQFIDRNRHGNREVLGTRFRHLSCYCTAGENGGITT